MDTTPPTRDDPAYVRQQVLDRFQHFDLNDPLVKALVEEAIRRRLGLPREAR